VQASARRHNSQCSRSDMDHEEFCSHIGVDPAGPLGASIKVAFGADGSAPRSPSLQERLDDLKGKIHADLNIAHHRTVQELRDDINLKLDTHFGPKPSVPEQVTIEQVAKDLTKQVSALESHSASIASLARRVSVQSRCVLIAGVTFAISTVVLVVDHFVSRTSYALVTDSPPMSKIDFASVDKKFRGQVLKNGPWRAAMRKDVLVSYRPSNEGADGAFPWDDGGIDFPADAFASLERRFPGASMETLGPPWFSVRGADVVLCFRKVAPPEMQRILHEYGLDGRAER